ncbi:MAG: gliding motility-associated C-terminal domain-containing protein [Vicingaceae bacterium]|nr:gliding motility-associated C-terminal domain-containing protein [Vicingaceae bacterium]
MSKQLLFISFLLFNCFAQAQCPISVSITSIPDVAVGPVCKNTAVQLTATPSVGAIGNVTQYVWVSENDTLSSNISTLNLLANNQNVIVYMETTSGCASDTVSKSIQVQTVTMVSVANPTVIPCNQTVTDIQMSTSGTGTPLYSYDLSTYGTSSGGSYSSVSVGSYTLITTDDNGCKDTTEIVITQETCKPPSPTDRITPNGDGYNDTWQILNIEDYPENEVFIFDRWGQRVYHKKGYDNSDGWSADYLGVDLPVSTYYYLLEIKPENGGDEIIMRGPISVFR